MSDPADRAGRVIAHVVLSLDVGGAEVLVTRMARSLRDSGFRPHVFCLDLEGALAPTLRQAGVPVALVGRRPGIIDPVCVWRLWRLLRQAGATLVHTHDFDAFFYGGLASWLAGRPLIHTQHGLPSPFGPLQRYKVAALRHVGRHFVGVSDEVTAVGIASGWFVRDRTTTITNGIDVDAFRPDPSARQRMRQLLGISDRALVVICVARMARIKDHTTLLEGFAASPVSGSGHLLLVGDGPERPHVEGEVRRLGLAGKVHVLGTRADVRELLAAADVFALTSRSEGISVSLLEGMATGLVPVVTAVGGNMQVVQPEGPAANGLMFPSGATAALAEILRRLDEHPDLRTRLASGARAAVRERFSHAAMMDRYIAAYRFLTDARG